MGNQKSDINIEKFRKEDWQAVQKLPDLQVWQNRKEPSYRIQQYELYTQNQAQLRHEKKMFELRRRSPLLVAAYYLQLQPNEQFCSSHSKHLLYLERIPIRLLDIEHVPYPDYLHLFDACLKGFGQLARCAGYFVVDEGMIGINEQGMAKAWLNQDFSKSYPFGGQTTQENMVRSLIDTIQRNIDSQLLPNSVPSVRNFLYKSSDALTFDTAIWQMGEFVRRFNEGKVPTKLDCIDRAGGIYTIANRQQINVNNHIQRRDDYKLQNGTGFSEVSAYGNNIVEQKLVRHTSNPQLQHHNSQIVNQRKDVQFSHQSNILSQPQLVPINRQQIQTNIGSPRQAQMAVRRSNIIENSPTINFTVQSQINNVGSPRNSQQILFQSPRQVRKIQIPSIQPPMMVPLPISRSPSHNVLPNTINYQRPIPQNPSVVFNQPFQAMQPVSPRAMQPQFFPPSHHITQKIVHNSVIVPPPLPPQPPPKQATPFTPQVNKALKFTVQVVPGKVYPQKSSTIFKQSNASKSENVEREGPLLLDNHNPIIAVSEKNVIQEKEQNEKPLQQKPQQQTDLTHEQTKLQKLIIKQESPSHVLEQQTHQHQYKDKQTQKQHQPDVPSVALLNADPLSQHHKYVENINQYKLDQQIQRPFIAKAENNFDAIQRKAAVSTSYEGEEVPDQYYSHKNQELPIVQQKPLGVNEEPGLRQDRMSLWTAGSQQKSVDYEQMEKKLAISFNPAYEENASTEHEQYHYSNPNQNYYQNHHNDEANYQNYQQQTQKYQFNENYGPNIEENVQDKLQEYRQGSSIKQTGKFGYSSSPNDLVDPQVYVNSDQIYSTATFKTSSENQHRPLYNQYESHYNPNKHVQDYENYNNLNDYKYKQSNYPSSFAYTSNENINPFISNNYEYQDTLPINKYTTNYSALQQSDGKSSPEFLKRLNELTTLQTEGPRSHYSTYQSQQSSNYQNNYLKNMSNENPYSFSNNEVNYGSYLSHKNYDDYNEFSHSGDYFKSQNYKINIDQE